MVTAFWSPHYREETPEILALVAGMCCRQFPCSIACVENYVHVRNLGFHLLGSRYDVLKKSTKRESEVSYRAGELFVRQICYEMGRSCQYGSVIRADQNGLWFMPMNQSLHGEAYRYVMSEVLDQQLDFLEEQYDDVFINLEPNNNDTTVTMLDRAKIVVVCLPATKDAFMEFYDMYRSMVGKCFFVFYGTQGSPEALLKLLRTYAPKHTMRCCYLPMTRILRKYLEEGRGLDYLDSYNDVCGNLWRLSPTVAEDAAEYCSSAGPSGTPVSDYRRWKNDMIKRFDDEEISRVVYMEGNSGAHEVETIRSIRYIGEWLMQREYPDAEGDCVLIAERMMRRRIMPAEVREWEMLRQRQ